MTRTQDQYAWLDPLLTRWAAWRRSGGDRVLGYPRQAPYARETPRYEAGPATPDLDDTVVMVDRCICRMPLLQRRAIAEEYTHTATQAAHARACRCSPHTYRARLARAYEWLDVELRV